METAKMSGVPTEAPRQSSPDQRHREMLRDFGASHYLELRASYERNAYFHRYLNRIISRQIPPGASVLDVGCGNGNLLAQLRPQVGIGIDLNPEAIADARQRHPEFTFHTCAVEDISTISLPKVDYVIVSGVLQQLYDLHTALAAIATVCHVDTRLIFCTYSRLWQPFIRLAEMIGRKMSLPAESWIPPDEIVSLLTQGNYTVVRQRPGVIMPLGVPVLADVINRWIAPLPGFRHLPLCTLTVARPLRLPEMSNYTSAPPTDSSVSVVIPVRNEAGNIQPLLDRLPHMASRQEVIFVEGNSTDNTWEAVLAAVASYQGPMKLTAMKQDGKGKGDAVRKGFAAATGEILLILDGDISVPPEELPRFVNLIRDGRCEFANGSRLVYPMEKQAMQFLNMIANKCFGYLFTYLLGQRVRDTLCGTKVLSRNNYLRIAANRAYFGDFDPFGDFDLLFGAAHLNLQISDVPVHYKQRVYGETNISRFRHGVMLLQMCLFAARKITFV